MTNTKDRAEAVTCKECGAWLRPGRLIPTGHFWAYWATCPNGHHDVNDFYGNVYQLKHTIKE